MNEMNEGPPPKEKNKSSRAVVRKALRDERAVLKMLRMKSDLLILHKKNKENKVLLCQRNLNTEL